MTYNEVLEALLDNLPEKYSKVEGSVIRDLLSPVAYKLVEIYDKIDNLTDNAFAFSSQGSWLDMKAYEQGLVRKLGSFATGEVTITGKPEYMVHSGTKVTNGVVVFEVTESQTIPESGEITVNARATDVGYNGNVKAGEINAFLISQMGLKAVTNKSAFNGGVDAETDDELRQRFFDKVNQPTVSGNKNNYMSWSADAGAEHSVVYPLWNGVSESTIGNDNGYVTVVISNADGSPVTSDMLAKVKEYLENIAPIGAKVVVKTTNKIIYNVHIEGIVQSEDKSEEIINAVNQYLTGVQVKDGIIRIKQIEATILSVDGVQDLTKVFLKDLEGDEYNSNITLGKLEYPVANEVVLDD